jgi:hypothetical protein
VVVNNRRERPSSIRLVQHPVKCKLPTGKRDYPRLLQKEIATIALRTAEGKKAVLRFFEQKILFLFSA